MPGTGGILPISYGYDSMSPYSTMYDAYMPQFTGAMYSPYGMGGYLGYGMGGYYGGYPMSMMGYPVYMQEMYNQRERLSIDHAHDMHKRVVDMEAAAYNDSNKAIVRKTLSNGTVLKSMNSLHEMVKKGDQNGVCEEFDRLVADVMQEYGDEFASQGKGYNSYDGAITVIESMYSSLYRSKLRDDIKHYGDGALVNGFMQGFREDHHTKTVDDTIHHIYGERIDQYQSKKNKQQIGKVAGILTYGAEQMILGAGIGATTYTGLWGCTKLGKMLFKTGSMKFNFKSMGKWAAVAAALYAGYKVVKRIVNKNNDNNQ